MATVPSKRDACDAPTDFSCIHETLGRDSDQQLGLYPQGVPRQLRYPNIPAWKLLDRAASAVPERLATRFLGSSYTYRQINQWAIQLAGWLKEHQLQPGDRVGVLLPNCPEYLISLNAIWRAGGVAVAISPLSVRQDVHNLLRLTECKTVVCLDLLLGLIDDAQLVQRKVLVSLRERLPAWKRAAYLAARWHRTGRIRLANNPFQTWFWDALCPVNSSVQATDRDRDSAMPANATPADNPAYILSTGGTTADPKAVTLSHRNIVANAWQQTYWAGNSMGEETMLAVLPFFHSYGMSTMLASGCAMGATLVMQPRFHVRQAIAGIERFRPTVFHAVPAMLNAMNSQLRRRPADLSSLKWVISGGASLPVATAAEFAAHSGALVVEGYGLSEASPVTHVGPLDGRNAMGTIGLPLPDTDCRIVEIDQPSRQVSAGQVGELLVRGPQVMLGYWSNPQATSRAIQDGWLRTGDLARQTTAGLYRIIDRKKDLIITSGFNVYPADVETVLRECDDIADVAIVGVPDEQRGEIVKAFVVLVPGRRWNQNRLEKFARQKLAAQRRPRLWEHVDGDLPRNFLGKVIRRELRQFQLGDSA